MGAKNKKNKICYYTTYGVLQMASKHGSNLGLDHSAFASLAITKFLRGERELNPEFLIKDRSNPLYVRRDEMDQIYITSKIRDEIDEVAQRYQCSMAVVIFQAIYDLCYEMELNDGHVTL